MKIADKLYLIIPLYADDADTVIAYAHAAPVSRDVFQAHYKIIARTFTTLHGDSLVLGGPRIASYVLKDVAEQMGVAQSALSFMNEVKRLTNVLIATPTGWDSMPLHDAINQKALNEDDLSEVVNAVVYFTVASAMHPRRELNQIMSGVVGMWGAQISSLDYTAFIGSLETSTSGGHIMPNLGPGSSVPF